MAIRRVGGEVNATLFIGKGRIGATATALRIASATEHGDKVVYADRGNAEHARITRVLAPVGPEERHATAFVGSLKHHARQHFIKVPAGFRRLQHPIEPKAGAAEPIADPDIALTVDP